MIAKFSGDPELTSGQLSQLIYELKKQGIGKIEGNLILDTAVFASHDKASGWIWNDLTMCFNAPPAAINVDHNCFYVNLNADQPIGEFAKVDVPSAYPVQVFSSAYVVDKNDAPYCQLDVVVHDNNRYQIKGCLARQNKPFGLSFSVQDPTNYGANLITTYLRRAGIEFSGKIQAPLGEQKGTILAEHLSEPLQTLLKKMMKKSDNQIADALFRRVANHLQNRPATFQLSSFVVRNLLKTKAGVNFNNSVMADGSGLSRHNQVSAETMLKGRGSISAEPLAKNIMAKTGSLKGVYNLAGFMKNAKGQRIAFVQFINGYSTGELESKTKRAPLVNFEQQFYMALYNE